MPYPTPIIEIAFDDGPYVVSPTWTNVTSYVREFNTSRGVPDDWTLQADGSAQIVLDNRERRFDPFNRSGPYYGKLLPRRQIRIRATSGATTYDVFRGYVAGWPAQWTDAGYDSTVTLSCYDALQLLGSSSLPADWSTDYILSLSPQHFWKFDDPIIGGGTASTITDYGSRPGTFTTTTDTYQTPHLAPEIQATAAGAPVGLTQGANQQLPSAWTALSNTSISMWTRNNQPSANGSLVFLATNGLAMETTQITAGADAGKYRVTVRTLAVGYRWFTVNPYSINEVNHLAFTYDSATGTGIIYVNGVADTAARQSTTALSGGYTNELVSVFQGEFQQIASYGSVLTALNVSTIYQFGLSQFSETTAQRFDRLISKTPFPAGLTSPPTNPASAVLDISGGAVTASSELARVSDSEYAPLFVTKAGVLTQYQQQQIRTQTKSTVNQATYGKVVGITGLPMGPDIQIQYDGDSMRNVANIEMSGGGVVIDTNTGSVNTYGQAQQYVGTQVGSLEDAQQIGDIVTGWGGQVYEKFSPFSVVLSPDGSWGSTLGLELFDRIRVLVQPPAYDPIVSYALVSRITHNVTPERWETALEGSVRWASVFILDQSTLGGTDLLG